MGKTKRVRSAKACDECQIPQAELFRVKYAAFDSWRLLCKDCQQKVKPSPSYQYGGTWKQHKRH